MAGTRRLAGFGRARLMKADRMRQLVLSVGLTITYLALVTPLAWLLKLMRRAPLAMQMDPRAPTYWNPVQIDSGDRRLYQDASLWRSLRDLREVAQACPALSGRSRVIARAAILLSLLPWKPLAAEPKGAELRHDLYVMF